MINLFVDLLSFLVKYCPLIMSLIILTWLVVTLSDSIKKHAKYYYIFFGFIAFLTLIQYFNGFFEFIEKENGVPFNLFRDLPVLGPILRANFHLAQFGYPLLIIIMYVGALNPKKIAVKKVLKIRKELSLIVGCPILCHSLIRITKNFVGSLHFFGDTTVFMQERKIVAEALPGLILSNAGYILGIVLVVLFLLLWITSFSSIHRRLGNKRWKKIQKWSYLLYALLFVHSMLLHSGWLLADMAEEIDKQFIIREGIAMASTTIIFASYLYLRLKKAKTDGAKRNKKQLTL